MLKVCDCIILKKVPSKGKLRKYRYFVQANGESGWANSSCNYNVGDSATLCLKTALFSDQWFAVVQ